MAKEIENLSDESLMARVKEHDHQAFSVLVKRHSEKFYYSSCRIVMNQQEAEDIVQDAFLKLWANPKIWKSDKGAKFTSWFYRIVMNLSVDRYRKNKKFLDINDEQKLSETAKQFDEVQRTQEQKVLDSVLKILPEKQFLALNLCFYEELSRKEAACIMNVSVKAVESLLMRAKSKLKDEFFRRGIIQNNKETQNYD